MHNLFSLEWFRTWTRFETERQENSEMAYSELILSVIGGVFSMAKRETEGRRPLILRKIICDCRQ